MCYSEMSSFNCLLTTDSVDLMAICYIVRFRLWKQRESVAKEKVMIVSCMQNSPQRHDVALERYFDRSMNMTTLQPFLSELMFVVMKNHLFHKIHWSLTLGTEAKGSSIRSLMFFCLENDGIDLSVIVFD